MDGVASIRGHPPSPPLSCAMRHIFLSTSKRQFSYFRLESYAVFPLLFIFFGDFIPVVNCPSSMN